MHHTKRDWDFLEIIFCLEEILEIPVDVIYNFDRKLSIQNQSGRLYISPGVPGDIQHYHIENRCGL